MQTNSSVEVVNVMKSQTLLTNSFIWKSRGVVELSAKVEVLVYFCLIAVKYLLGGRILLIG